MRLPDLTFSEYFLDHNHEHNVDEEDVLDAVLERRILISGAYTKNQKTRRAVLAKTDSNYITIICEEADDFWWVITAYPSGDTERKRAKAATVGKD